MLHDIMYPVGSVTVGLVDPALCNNSESASGDDSTSKTTGQRTEDTDGKSNVLPAIKVSSLTEVRCQW